MDGWFLFALDRYNYWIFIVLMMTGLYIVFAHGNLVKKIVGLNIFQTSVFIYYISIGKIAGGTAPIYMGGELEAAAHHGPETDAPEGHGAEAAHGVDAAHDTEAAHGAAGDAAHGASDALHGAVEAIVYTNPLPHVLILTAIVVGVATTAVGLALAVRIREAYGTIEEDELDAADEIAEFGEQAGASVAS